MLLQYWNYLNNISIFFRPQNLELTAVNEIVLMDNLNIFQMNGFHFEFQEDGMFF